MIAVGVPGIGSGGGGGLCSGGNGTGVGGGGGGGGATEESVLGRPSFLQRHVHWGPAPAYMGPRCISVPSRRGRSTYA
jgi:hypothetical protein